MNWFPFLAPNSVSLGLLIGYFIIKSVARRMGKPLPGIGELLFPIHHKDSKLDKRHRKGNR